MLCLTCIEPRPLIQINGNMAYTGQIQQHSLNGIRWRLLEGECFGGMGGGQCLRRSDRGEVCRRGGERQPCAFEMEVCGSAMQRVTAPSSHKSVTSKPHHYHIPWRADILLHMGKKNEHVGGRVWESHFQQSFVFSCCQPTICYSFWGSWHELSNRDSCCNWSKKDLKLLCMRFLWPHITRVSTLDSDWSITEFWKCF